MVEGERSSTTVFVDMNKGLEAYLLQDRLSVYPGRRCARLQPERLDDFVNP